MSVVAGALDGDLDAFLRDEGGERHEAHSRDGSGRDEGEFQTPPRRQWTEAEWREWNSCHSGLASCMIAIGKEHWLVGTPPQMFQC